MPSFDAINYSLRPSKSIQRQIIFDGVKSLQGHLDLERLVYIGFGSIWFTDFVMAHKLLGVTEMYSIEGNPVGYRRACFNRPYATVSVMEGCSSEVLPKLYGNACLAARPWMLWLDYDYELNESVVADVRSVVENAPENSILLVTFNGLGRKYGHVPQRPSRLRELLRSVVPDELSKDSCKDEHIQSTLADLTLDFMRSVAADLARPGGFLPSFRVTYQDGAPMVTVGGLLPAKGAARVASDIVNAESWMCRPQKTIKAPHLTIKEAVSLQALLPRSEQLSREVVRELGFDLEEEQIESFEKYYRQYPAFAQIIA